MLVDSHCHLDQLDLAPFHGNLELALASAKDYGVEYFLCVSVDLVNFHRVLSIAEAYPQISASAGVHPNEQEFDEPSVEQLVELAQHKKVVAIGETGLDYFRSKGDLDWQRKRFRNHIEAAKQVKKPLIIHTRNAQDDTIKLLRECKADEVGGVMHCFTESFDMAKKAMDLNFDISFSGIITFKNAEEIRDVARQIPLERLLVETDAPYLTPVPYRGKANQPGYVRYVAECIANLRQIEFNQLAEQTTKNFFRLFKNARNH